MKKIVYTLNIDGYSKAITDLTYPLLERYAAKIGAEFRVITERKYPDFPPVYEKMQIHELGKESDWNIYIDSDAIVHPDMFDVTDHISQDTVMHFATDLAGCRWKYDKYFRRDGRHIGSANWFTVASNWCLDLWKPLDDMTLAQAVQNIQPSAKEKFCTPEHLIDDYVLSRNIARYGLKVTTFTSLMEKLKDNPLNYFWHTHLISGEAKIDQLAAVKLAWGI